MERKTISVTGMSCTGCEESIETALETIAGIQRIEADHEGDAVALVLEDGVASDEIPANEISAAVRNVGYEVVA